MSVAVVWPVGVAVALCCWKLRRNHGPTPKDARLLDDLRAREQQALEINDSVLQGLVVSKMALDLGDVDRARAALDHSIDAACRIVTHLLGNEHVDVRLLRSAPPEVPVVRTPTWVQTEGEDGPHADPTEEDTP